MTLSCTCPGFGAAARWSGHLPLHAIDEGLDGVDDRFTLSGQLEFQDTIAGNLWRSTGDVFSPAFAEFVDGPASSGSDVP